MLVAALACLSGGCFDYLADARFRPDGSALIDVEIAVSVHLLQVTAAAARRAGHASPLDSCAMLKDKTVPRPGVKVLKAVPRRREGMVGCSLSVEIQDPTTSLQPWEAMSDGKEAPPILPAGFHVTRRDARSYTLTGLFKPRADPDSALDPKNPNAAKLLAAMDNHYVTLTVRGARVENTTGELSSDRRSATWKLPLRVLAVPPPDFRQEVRADIVYKETPVERIKRWIGRN